MEEPKGARVVVIQVEGLKGARVVVIQVEGPKGARVVVIQVEGLKGARKGPHPSQPYPRLYYERPGPRLVVIVEAGADAGMGGAPCGRLSQG